MTGQEEPEEPQYPTDPTYCSQIIATMNKGGRPKGGAKDEFEAYEGWGQIIY